MNHGEAEPTSSAPRWRSAMALLLMVAVLAFIYRRLLAGWVLADGDLHTYFFPYWSQAARAFQTGELPVWNPYLFAGAPFLANSQAGVLYPLNWPLWLLSGPTLAGMARTLHGSVLLHLALAGVNAHLLARRLGASAWGAALAGLLYAGGGFLGLHVEHLNQLQGLAWLPLVLMRPAKADKRRLLPSAVSVLAFALILLAGHTQTAFIAAVGVIIVFLAERMARRTQEAKGRFLPLLGRVARDLPTLLIFALAALMAAAQLLPTVELARFSMRAGGLPWNEAVSFSVAPWTLPWALLPTYLAPPLLPESVAYLGLVGLLLAGWGAWRAVRARDAVRWAFVVVAAGGLFLALGGYNPLYLLAARLRLPGVVQFRAPARYLALFVVGGSMLAGVGLSEIEASLARVWGGVARVAGAVLFVGLAGLELALAAERLPHADATVPRAYSDFRPATSHLVAATREEQAAERPPGRFLSISKTLFDAGDTGEIERLYGPYLSPDALWTYLVAAKDREVLAPNLPLAFAVPAVDGYDGGLLPLRHYATFTRLLLPGGTADGRLRENLDAVPDERWLSLLDVRFLITDKVGDTWVADVFYDRQFRPALAPDETLSPAWLPADFRANGLSLFYEGTGSVDVALDDGRRLAFELPPAEATEPHPLGWSPPGVPLTMLFRAGDGELTLSGATLVDDRTGAFYPLVLSERFRLAHSGDVKIYEEVAPGARAFLAHEATCYADGEDAGVVAALAGAEVGAEAPLFLADCGRLWRDWEVTADRSRIVPFGEALPAGADEEVRVVRYAAHRVEVEARLETEGFLVLKDAWYPGWEVGVEPIAGGAALPPFPAGRVPLRANLLFRAVPLPAGEWRVTFRYRPRALTLGVVLSLGGCLGWVGYAIMEARYRRRP